MKVLDLQCADLHVFEGWFASEEDFSDQRTRRAIQCPVCSNSDIVKRLSAPRLSLGVTRSAVEKNVDLSVRPEPESKSPTQEQWLQICKDILARTVDVGTGFTEAARKIHYGEAPVRAIRGQATQEQVQTLVDEGISVLPFPVPEFLLGSQH